MTCEKCGETENVKLFFHFDTQEREPLCWPCRRPIVMARGRRTEPESEPPSGQSGLSDFA